MTTPKTAAARRRAALLLCAAFGAATIASPVLANAIETTRTVRLANIAQPTSPAEEATVRNRVAAAAEEACGSDRRSLPDYRYAVRNSDCFAQSYDTAMQQLQDRWGSARVSGGGAGKR